MTLTLTSLGGAGTVTGSRHLLEWNGRRMLIDCGLFQGYRELQDRNSKPFPVNPATLDAVILTHAHLDHSGYVPKLIRDGFAGDVICTSATADLCEVLLRDSAFIAEKDAERAGKGRSRRKPAPPLYTIADAEAALERFTPRRFGETTTLPNGAALTFRRAGHILGAAIVEIRWGGRTIVFSGDLGRYGDPYMFDPAPVAEADYVVIESTYGDRVHPKHDPMDALGAVIERTVQRGGSVIIPAFAVGRAQLILYHLWMLKQAGRIASVPVFLDSPMAINATDILCRHLDDHRFTPEICEATCGVATYLREVEASKAVTGDPMPKVVLAASGMLSGGRVLHHLRASGPDPKSTILFAGYQAAGTRGARLLDGAGEINLFGRAIPIRAEVASLPALSAHADADELLQWLGGFRKPPQRLFVVHGEPAASDALAKRAGAELGWTAAAAELDRVYDLGRAP